MKISNLLDDTKAALKLKTDGELARNLGVSKQAISDYYNNKRAPDDYACLKIAEALGKPLDTVIATVKAASEKDETRREAWENYMKRLGGIAASFMLGGYAVVTFLVTSPYSEAAPLLVLGTGTFCIMLSLLCCSQLKTILRRIRKKCTFSVNVLRIRQITA